MNKYANMAKALQGLLKVRGGAPATAELSGLLGKQPVDSSLEAIHALVAKRRAAWEAAQAKNRLKLFGTRGPAPDPVLPDGASLGRSTPSLMRPFDRGSIRTKFEHAKLGSDFYTKAMAWLRSR